MLQNVSSCNSLGYTKILLWREENKGGEGTSECVQTLWSNRMTKRKTHWAESLDSTPSKQWPMAPKIWRY